MQHGHARAWQSWRGQALPLGARRPQTPARPERIVGRVVFHSPGCVLRIGTLWEGFPWPGEASRVGAARGPLPWPASGRCGFPSFERPRNVILAGTTRQGGRPRYARCASAPLTLSYPPGLASPRKPTVCHVVTSVVADTYGHGDATIGPTCCAVIDGVLGDRCSRGRVGRTPRSSRLSP